MTGSDSSRVPLFSVSTADAPGGGAVVTVYGELDMATAPEVRAALERAVEADGEVIVDLRACGFIDSTGIAVLMTAAWQLKNRNRVLILEGVRDRVQRIFDLTGLASNESIVLRPARFADGPASA